MSDTRSVVVLGAGLAGCCVALRLAQLEHRVTLVDRKARPVSGASRHNEGKLHLRWYIYAADPAHKTHHVVMAGSLSFLDAIEQVTRVPQEAIPRSHGFVYVVHADSLLSVDDIRRHFAKVDTLLADHTGRALAPTRDLPDEFVRSTYADSTQAAIHTSEMAVDPNYVASVVGAAVLAEPLIDFSAIMKSQGLRWSAKATESSFGLPRVRSDSRGGRCELSVGKPGVRRLTHRPYVTQAVVVAMEGLGVIQDAGRPVGASDDRNTRSAWRLCTLHIRSVVPELVSKLPRRLHPRGRS